MCVYMNQYYALNTISIIYETSKVSYIYDSKGALLNIIDMYYFTTITSLRV